jgi:ketosteroid isomerase-like protein
MRKIASIAGLALASTLLVSLAASSAPLYKPPATTVAAFADVGFEKDVRAIAEVRERWVRAVNRGDVAALLRLYGPGAVIDAESAPPLLGSPEIGNWHSRWSATTAVLYDVDARLLRIDDGLAVEEWRAYVTVTPDDDDLAIGSDVFQFRQEGIRVYRKDARGRWRIDRETWSADPPAVQAYAHPGGEECVWRVC